MALDQQMMGEGEDQERLLLQLRQQQWGRSFRTELRKPPVDTEGSVEVDTARVHSTHTV